MRHIKGGEKTMTNAYQILGVDHNATEEEIKEAFRKKVMDVCDKEGNQKLDNGEYYIDVLVKARDVLLNKEKREELDYSLDQYHNTEMMITDGINNFALQLRRKQLEVKKEYLATIIKKEIEKKNQLNYPKRKIKAATGFFNRERVPLEDVFGALFSDNTFGFYWKLETLMNPEITHCITHNGLPTLKRDNTKIPNENSSNHLRTEYSNLVCTIPAFRIIPVSLIKNKSISLKELQEIETWIQLLLTNNPSLTKSLFEAEMPFLYSDIFDKLKEESDMGPNYLCNPREVITSLIPEVFEKYQKGKKKFKLIDSINRTYLVLGKTKSVDFAIESCENDSKNLVDCFTGHPYWKHLWQPGKDPVIFPYPWYPGCVFYLDNNEYTAIPLYKLVPPTERRRHGIITEAELKKLYFIISEHLKKQPELIENLFGEDRITREKVLSKNMNK